MPPVSRSTTFASWYSGTRIVYRGSSRSSSAFTSPGVTSTSYWWPSALYISQNLYSDAAV